MPSATVSVHGCFAGALTELARNRAYRFTYESDYRGPPVSITLPVRPEPYDFDRFPYFFDGLLPEGAQLEALLRTAKIVDRGGTYILKPPHAQYPNLPEKEDLTMRLAEAAGIEVPVHGLVSGRDGSWTCFIRRFDRMPRGRMVAVEDFAQLAEARERRSTKPAWSKGPG